MPTTRSRPALPRTFVLTALAVLLAAALAGGCTSAPPAQPSGSSAPSGSTPLKAALVLDTGGVDDRSFNASAWAGMQRAMKDLGVEGKYVESRVPADYKTNLTQFANSGYNVVFAVGYKMEDALKEVAPQYPQVKFAIVDGSAPNDPNCESLQFHEEQGCFLAGYLAASVSRTGKIGFVGGEDIPLIKKFEAGYRAGAKTANPGVQVLPAYTGDWNDLEKGKTQAEMEFANGADVIFHAAGKGGAGVIEAARERGPGFYAIGVDQDQDNLAPGRVLTSMVKHTDTAVYDTIQRVRDGKFTPGAVVYGLKDGGVGLTDMRYTRQDVPPVVRKRLGELTKLIDDGKVVVPTTVDAVAAFVPPTLPRA